MIPFDFDYYRPDTLKEAIALFSHLDDAGEHPVWYGGGTELLSMARMGELRYGAVIDTKSIQECRTLHDDGENVVFGAAVTLSDIVVSDKFPLLQKTVGRIADHTIQNRITLGGNLAGTIIYREAALPLLLGDAELTAAGKNGLKQYSLRQVFDGRLRLPAGELFVSAAVPRALTQAPYFHIKKTKNEKIDYPLVTAAGLIADGYLRLALSGLAAYPFRDLGVEAILNDHRLTFQERAQACDTALSGVIHSDLSGSAEYRRFVFKNTIINILEAAKELKIPCLF